MRNYNKRYFYCDFSVCILFTGVKRMEKITVSEIEGNISLKIVCNPAGTGKCTGFEDTFVKEAMTTLAQNAEIDLEVQTDTDRAIENREQYMKLLGKILAQIICKRCETQGQYRGVGRAQNEQSDKECLCELYLPGRVDWVYEVITQNCVQDKYGISVFFKSIAENAKLRLKLRVWDYTRKNSLGLFEVFGKSLKMAFSAM